MSRRSDDVPTVPFIPVTVAGPEKPAADRGREVTALSDASVSGAAIAEG
jgi:hypothetical protein